MGKNLNFETANQFKIFPIFRGSNAARLRIHLQRVSRFIQNKRLELISILKLHLIKLFYLIFDKAVCSDDSSLTSLKLN